MRRMTVVTVLALTTLTGAIALARGGGGGFAGQKGGPGFGHGLERCLQAEELNLTDAQKDALKTLRLGARDEAKKNFEEMGALREALHATFTDPKADKAAVKAKADALHAAMDRTRSLFFDRLLEARAVLTADQITILADLPECRFGKDRMGGGRGRHRGDGPGMGMGRGPGMGMGCPGCPCGLDAPDEPPAAPAQ